MVDFISTPLLVTLILGVVGLAIPVIDAFKKERGSNNRLYSGIAFGALVVTIGIVIFRVLAGEVMPAVFFSKGVLADDLFGSFFAIALLIVSIMVTASSWNYMKGRTNPAPLLFVDIAIKYRYGAYCIFNRSCNAARCLGINVYSYICFSEHFQNATRFQMRRLLNTLCSVHYHLPFLFLLLD